MLSLLIYILIGWITSAHGLLVKRMTYSTYRRNDMRSRNLHLAAEVEYSFSSEQEYLKYVQEQSILPKGFQCGATRFMFAPDELNDGSNERKIKLPMNVTLIALDVPSSSYAAMFTSNKFPGGPILVGKERYLPTDDTGYLNQLIQAVVINNKVSNVCPGGLNDMGRGDCETICNAVADVLELKGGAKSVFPSSTGIIGWKLPVSDIISHLGDAKKNFQSISAYPAALGITTTDRYPKARTYTSKDGRWRITGVAKGAGMIEPNLATMLAYLMTDLDVPQKDLQEILKRSVETSFNTISIDGDQSTSDTVLVLSSQQVPLLSDGALLDGAADAISTISSAVESIRSTALTNTDDTSASSRSIANIKSTATIATNTKLQKQSNSAEEVLNEFEDGLKSVCQYLADMLVRNGEGTMHVMRVVVKNSPSWRIGRDLGAAIVNSNLVKCAVSGNDPNVGRIIGAVGSYLGNIPNGELMAKDLEVHLGGRKIFSKGAFLLDGEAERELSDYMVTAQLYDKDIPEHARNYPPHSKSVDIEIVLSASAGKEEVVVIGSDLTRDYVDINADYRS